MAALPAETPLIVVSPEGTVHRADPQKAFLVGRDPRADVSIEDPRVSRIHLIVIRDDDGWLVRDRSSNGTFSDGQPMEGELRVSSDAVLHLGQPADGPAIELRVGTAADGARPAPVQPSGSTARRSPRRPSEVHRLPRPDLRVGRAPDNDIVLDDLVVSRHHARMTLRTDGKWELLDLDSGNGTFVNGQRVAGRSVLQELDLVAVGRHTFRLVEDRLEEYVDGGRITFEANELRTRAADGRILLDGVSFRLDERSMLAVIGPSGSGKSTLLGALTGISPSQEGSVLYDGRDLYAVYEEVRTRIGYVPQDDIVHYPLTVRESLGYGAELRFARDVDERERDRRVDEVIEELGLTTVRDVPISTLSGGERRRVCVGLELMTKPSLLFLDEPTAGLDPGLERDLMELLRALADGGRTVVLVTHSVESLRLCDRVLVLASGGRPSYFGPAQLAPAYFGRDDFEEVFQDLRNLRDRDWSLRFREHPYYERFAHRSATETAAVERPRATAPARRRAGEWFAQLSMQTRRYARITTADRRNLALLVAQPLLLGLLMLAALPAGELGAPPEGELRLVSSAGLVLLMVVLAATWLGASNAYREIVKERAVLARERGVGQSVSAYVLSKAVVLGVIVCAQVAFLVPLATARQGLPAEGSFFGWALGELVVGAGLAGLAGLALGLLISAVAATVDRASTVLPIVLVVELILALGGLFPEVVERPVLKQASYAASTQWAFSTAASTVDLARLQSLDRIARDIPAVRPEDPLPVLRALSDPGPGERRWRHDWQTWLLDAAAMVALTGACLLAAILLLARRRGEM